MTSEKPDYVELEAWARDIYGALASKSQPATPRSRSADAARGIIGLCDAIADLRKRLAEVTAERDQAREYAEKLANGVSTPDGKRIPWAVAKDLFGGRGR